MILRETKDFTVECAFDDEWTQSIADSLVNIFSKYRLDEAEYGQSVGVIADGTRFLIRYKVLS